jgi:tyrosine-protein phosphatase YwqE
MKDMLFQIFTHGYTPLLAHPERYRYYQQDEKIYHTFKDQGCLFQLDLLSLQGAYGRTTRKTAIKLLKLGMIDYVGSDMHHADHAQLLRDFLNSRDSAPLSALYR